jgi:hypothetical protein
MSWIPLSLLVVSFPLSAIFLIGCYSEGLFCALLSYDACERCTWSLVREHPIHLISSQSSSFALYLMLDDERCLNSLLSLSVGCLVFVNDIP